MKLVNLNAMKVKITNFGWKIVSWNLIKVIAKIQWNMQNLSKLYSTMTLREKV